MIYLSRYDSLTKIYNRSYFEELLNNTRSECEKENNIFSLAILAIDNLKNINDTYGHEAGDAMIVHFVHTINRVMQKPDCFARIGGVMNSQPYLGKGEKVVIAVLPKQKILLENPIDCDLTNQLKFPLLMVSLVILATPAK